MPPVIVAAAAWAAGYAATAWAVGATLVAAGSIGAGLVFAGTAMAVSYFGNALFGEKPPDPDLSAADYGRGVLLNKAGNTEPIPVVYGSRRVGAARVYLAVTDAPAEQKWVESGYWFYYGDSGMDWIDTSHYEGVFPACTNGYLHIVLALCEGPISAINTVYFNDVPSTDARFTDLVTINKHLGADDQGADADLMAACPEWTADHRLRGVAYLYIRLRWNQDAFPTGLPVITADIDGKTVYDPRDASSAFSHNPALNIRDYLTNPRYGRGIPADRVPDSYIIAAANYCDETVEIGGGEQARYTCDGVVNVNNSTLNNTKELLSSCRALLIFSGGLYRLIIDKPEVSTFDFTEDNITGSWSIPLANKKNTYNRIRAKFFNPDKAWQEDIAPVESTELRALDNGLVLETEISLPFTADAGTAKQIATIELNQSRQQTACRFTAFISGMRCEVGNVVTITHGTPGWSAKKFRILGIALKNNDEVIVTAREYAETVYDFGTILAYDSAPNTNLPSLTSIAPPFNIEAVEEFYNTGKELQHRVILTWEPPPDAFVASYEVEYKLSSAETWFHVANIRTPSVTIPQLAPGMYDFRVRSINTIGVSSAWASITQEITGDPEIETPAVTGIVTTGLTYAIRLDMTFEVSPEFAAVEIWAAETNFRNYAVKVGESAAPTWTHTGLDLIDSRYYWVRIRNTYGTYGAWYPENVTAGIGGVTSTDPSDYLDVLTGSLSESELVADLNEKIGLLDKVIPESIMELVLTGDKTRGGLTRAEFTLEELSTDLFAEASSRLELAAAILGEDGTGTMSGIIYEERLVRVSAESSLASSISSLSSTVSGHTSAISSEISTRASADSAISSSVTTLQSTVNGHTASIEEHAEAISDIDGYVSAAYTLKLNANGRVVGFGLMTSGTSSEFAVMTDKFYIVSPSDNGKTNYPFTVGTINGNSTVGIDGDLIVDGSILTRHLATDTLTALDFKTHAQVGAGGHKGVHISAAENEMYFYGDRGDGTIERLAAIGITTDGTDYAIGRFGSLNSSRIAVFGISASDVGVLGWSDFNTALVGYSNAGFALEALGDAYFDGNNTFPSGANWDTLKWGNTTIQSRIGKHYHDSYGGIRYESAHHWFVTGGVVIGSASIEADDGDLYIVDNCSAASFTDRTPHYDGDALSEIKAIRGTAGSIDHSTLPVFARRVKKIASEQVTFGKRVRIAREDALQDFTDTVCEAEGKYILTRSGEVRERPVRKNRKKRMVLKPDIEFDRKTGRFYHCPKTVTVSTVDREERDLGAMISILTVGMQQLISRVETLEAKP